MDEHGLPIVGAGVDYRKIPSLEHRSTLVILNKFLAQTTSFLNRFSSVCEERLSELSGRIQRLDISLSMLESKLASIKSLEGVQAATTYEPPAALVSAGPLPTQDQPQQQQQQQAAPSSSSTGGAGPPPPPSAGPVPPVPEQPQEDNVMKIKDDPRFAKFFKMKRLGVHALQISMEMKKAGFDPALLDDEDAPAPKAGGTVGGAMGGASNSDSDSSDDDSSSSNDSDDDDDSFSD